MPLSAHQNTFAGNPLNRASERRGDVSWLAEKLLAPDSLAIALWNGKPLVEKAQNGDLQIAYIPSRMAEDLSGGAERLLFMGLWQETAVFAVDLEGGQHLLVAVTTDFLEIRELSGPLMRRKQVIGQDIFVKAPYTI